jgi:hypothetical protein
VWLRTKYGYDEPNAVTPRVDSVALPTLPTSHRAELS